MNKKQIDETAKRKREDIARYYTPVHYGEIEHIVNEKVEALKDRKEGLLKQLPNYSSQAIAQTGITIAYAITQLQDLLIDIEERLGVNNG